MSAHCKRRAKVKMDLRAEECVIFRSVSFSEPYQRHKSKTVKEKLPLLGKPLQLTVSVGFIFSPSPITKVPLGKPPNVKDNPLQYS